MYIPWIPYFFKLIQSDIFIFFDDVQYPRSKNYNNRNFIKTSQGKSLLSISLKNRSDLLNINKIEINNEINWQKKHWKSIYLNYKNSQIFRKYEKYFEELYLNKKWQYISDFNIELIKLISKLCNLETNFFNSSQLNLADCDIEQKIIKIITSFKANIYISGKGLGSMRHLNVDNLKKNNIQLKYCSYIDYSYKQLHGEFIKDCSILDLFFNLGEDSKKYLFDNSSLQDF